MTKTKQENKQKISGDMTIGEIVKMHPECIEIMLKYGLHCVGCSANAYETLEQGTIGHGMTEEVFKQMLKDINEAVVDTTGKTLTFTPKAANKILEILKKEKGNDWQKWGLRIQVVPGGCSGFQYEFAFDKEQREDDEVFVEQGVKIFVDKESLAFLRGALVDYLDTLQGAGFKVSNPNAKSTCGCGQSFA
ncbi:MAG: iron-sulfur cluster insertion protein ErpA [Candidatus Woesearchaeota archaeon]